MTTEDLYIPPGTRFNNRPIPPPPQSYPEDELLGGLITAPGVPAVVTGPSVPASREASKATVAYRTPDDLEVARTVQAAKYTVETQGADSAAAKAAGAGAQKAKARAEEAKAQQALAALRAKRQAEMEVEQSGAGADVYPSTRTTPRLSEEDIQLGLEGLALPEDNDPLHTNEVLDEYETSASRVQADLRRDAERVINAYAPTYINEALKRAGYVVEDGVLVSVPYEESSIEQFQRIQEDALADFIDRYVAPLETAATDQLSQLTMDTNALINSRIRHYNDQLAIQQEIAEAERALMRQAPEDSLRQQAIDAGIIGAGFFDRVSLPIAPAVGDIAKTVADQTILKLRIPGAPNIADPRGGTSYTYELKVGDVVEAAFHRVDPIKTAWQYLGETIGYGITPPILGDDAQEAVANITGDIAREILPASYVEFGLEFTPLGYGYDAIKASERAASKALVASAGVKATMNADEAVFATARWLDNKEGISTASEVLGLNVGMLETGALSADNFVNVMRSYLETGSSVVSRVGEELRVIARQVVDQMDGFIADMGGVGHRLEVGADGLWRSAIKGASDLDVAIDPSLIKGSVRVTGGEVPATGIDDAIRALERQEWPVYLKPRVDKILDAARELQRVAPDTLVDARLLLKQGQSALSMADSSLRGAAAQLDTPIVTNVDNLGAQLKNLSSGTAQPARVTASATLPRELAGAKPRYKTSTLEWESDIDKAAYITAQTKRSKRDADYLEFVKSATGWTDQQVREHGALVREKLKSLVPDEEDIIHVPNNIPGSAPTRNEIEPAVKAINQTRLSEQMTATSKQLLDESRIREESLRPIGDYIPPSMRKNLSDEARELLEYKLEDLPDEAWAELITGLAKPESREAAERISQLLIRELAYRKGRETTGNMLVNSLVLLKQENPTAVPMSGMSNIPVKPPKGTPPKVKPKKKGPKPPVEPPTGNVPSVSNIRKHPDAWRRYSVVDVLGERDVASLTDVSRRVLGRIRHPRTNAERELLKASNRASERLRAEIYMRETSNISNFQRLENAAFYDMRWSGLEGKNGAIVLSNGRRTSLAHVMNNPEGYELTGAQSGVVEKWLNHLSDLDDDLVELGGKKFPSTLDDIPYSRDLGIVQGEVLPKPYKKTADGPWFRRGMRALDEPEEVLYEQTGTELIYKAIKARKAVVDEAWINRAAENLADPKIILDDQIAQLNSRADYLTKRIDELAEAGASTEELSIELRLLRDKQQAIVAKAKAANRADIGGIFKVMQEINRAQRQLQATADLSFMGIQGLVGLTHDPVGYAQALVGALRHADFVLGETERLRYLADNAGRIDSFIKHGGFWGGTTNVSEFFGSDVFQHIPIARQVTNFSNATFSEFGNRLRLKMYNQAIDSWERVHKAPMSIKQQDDLVASINKVTGVGKEAASGTQRFFENILFFAPRFARAQFGLMSDAVTKGGDSLLGLPGLGSVPFLGRGLVGRVLPGRVSAAFTAKTAGDLARQSLLEFGTVSTALTIWLNESLGVSDLEDYLQPWKTALDGANYLNSNFLRVRWNDKDYSLLGQWDTMMGIVMTGGLEGWNARNPLKGVEAAGERFASFKASPLVRDIIGGFGTYGLLDAWRYFSATSLSQIYEDIGNTRNIMDVMGNVAVGRLSPIAVSQILREGLPGPWQEAALAGLLEAAGIKATPITESERRNLKFNELNDKWERFFRVKHPDWTDDEIAARARVQTTRDPEWVEADRAYLEANKDKDWAQRRLTAIGIIDDILTQKDNNDQVLVAKAEAGAEEKYLGNEKRLNDIDAELSQLFDDTRLRDLDTKIDAIIQSNQSVADQRDAIRREIANLQLQQNQVTREGVIRNEGGYAGRVSEAQERAIQELIDAAQDQIYQYGFVSLEDSGLIDLKYEIYAENDPKIAELIAERNRLNDEQQVWEDEIYDVWNSTRKELNIDRNSRFYQYEQQYSEQIELIEGAPPRDKADELYKARDDIRSQYVDEYGKFTSEDAQEDYFSMLEVFASNLNPADRALWDVINEPRTQTELEQQYLDAYNSTDAESGRFLGVDVRASSNKPPTKSLLTATAASTGLLPGPDTVARTEEEIAALEQQSSGAFIEARIAIDKAVSDVISGDPDAAVAFLATVAKATESDPGRFINEFETLVWNKARQEGIAYNREERGDFIEDIKSVTEGAIRRIDPAAVPEDVRVKVKPSEEQYDAVKDAKAKADEVNQSTTPSPEYAPGVASTATGTTAPDVEVGALDPAIAHFKNILLEDYFGATIDRRTGLLVDPGTSDIAPTNDATYEYLFNNNLETKDQILAAVQKLIKENLDNPAIITLVASDVYVNEAFSVDPTGSLPAGRNFIVAIDRILSTLDGSLTFSEGETLQNFKGLILDNYFTYGTSNKPEVKKINDQISALRDDAQVKQINEEVRLIGLEISDTYYKISAGILDRGTAEAIVAQLEQEREQLLQEKARITRENTDKINDLQNQRAEILGLEIPPNDAVYSFLLDRGVTDGYEIATSIYSLYQATDTDVVGNIVAVARGEEEPTPALAQWINDYRASLEGKVDDVDAVVRSRLFDIYELTREPNDRTPSDYDVREWIVAGSLLLTLTQPSDVDESILSDFDPIANKRLSGGSTTPTRGRNSTGRVPIAKFATPPAAGRPEQPSQPPAPPTQPTQPPQSTAPSGPPELTFSATSWPDFRRSITTIFGSPAAADALERYFVTGRDITNSSILEDLRFAYTLMPLRGASSFNGWLGALRLLFRGISTGSSGGGSRPFFPFPPEIRTRRSF